MPFTPSPKLPAPPKPFKIGVLIKDCHLRSRMAVFDGVVDFCLECGQTQAFLVPIREGIGPQPELLGKIDAIVSWGSRTDTWIVDLWKSGLPVVNCNTFLPGVPTVSSGLVHTMAYDYLVSLGRQSIGYVTSFQSDSGCLEEIIALQDVARRENLDCRIFRNVRVDPGLHPEHIITGVDEPELEAFLLDLPKPTALWCVNDEMAALVWRTATTLGIHVPNELALLGIGDHPCAIHSTPGISTIRTAGAQLGALAARLLYNNLHGIEALRSDTCIETSPPPIIERASTGGTNPVYHSIRMAWRLLEDYPSEGLTVERLVQESRVSRICFYKHFVDAFGILPGKAIRLSRLKKAKKLLLGSDMQISQIGSDCGFASEGDFSNFFKRETGVSPREWRKPNMLSDIIDSPALAR